VTSIEVESPPEFDDPIERLVWLRLMLQDEESLDYMAHSSELRTIINHYFGNTIMLVGELQMQVTALEKKLAQV
jgi:hypothetical protein